MVCWCCCQTYSKEAVDAVQEALTQAQKTHVLSQNIFQVPTSHATWTDSAARMLSILSLYRSFGCLQTYLRTSFFLISFIYYLIN